MEYVPGEGEDETILDVLGYGPEAAAVDGEVLERLEDARRRQAGREAR